MPDPSPPLLCLASHCRYDSTIGAKGGKNRQWPATMDGGVPYNCGQAGQECSTKESYPGMW